MLIKFKCNLCDNHIRKLIKEKKDIPFFLTCDCGGVMEKTLPEITTTSVEVVDNGYANKRLEIRKGINEKAAQRGQQMIDNLENRDKLVTKTEKSDSKGEK